MGPDFGSQRSPDKLQSYQSPSTFVFIIPIGVFSAK